MLRSIAIRTSSLGRASSDRIASSRRRFHEFLPFGFGNRHCLGAALAAYELKVVMATVLAEAELLEAARPPTLKRYNLGAAPDTGVPMVCVERRPNSKLAGAARA